MPIRLPIALLASAALLSCASDSFTAIDDAETLAETGWHEVVGGSVQLRSCGRAKESYALMGDLEETLAVVADVLPAVPTQDPAPFYLFVVCAGEAYDALAPLPRQGNHFVIGLRSRALLSTAANRPS